MTVLGVKYAKFDVLQVVAMNAAIGLGWLLCAPIRTSQSAYAPAKRLLAFTTFYPMRALGAALLLASLLLLVGAFSRSQLVYQLGTQLLIMHWLFWLSVFVIAFIGDNGGVIGMVWCIGWTVRHTRMPEHSPWVNNPLHRDE